MLTVKTREPRFSILPSLALMGESLVSLTLCVARLVVQHYEQIALSCPSLTTLYIVVEGKSLLVVVLRQPSLRLVPC